MFDTIILYMNLYKKALLLFHYIYIRMKNIIYVIILQEL